MGKLGGIVVALIIVGVLVTMKFQNQADVSEDVRAEVMAVMESFPNWESHQGLYIELFEEHHERVFDENYRMGGRRSSGSFDGDAYWEGLFSAMAAGALSRGYDDCVAILDEVAAYDGED